MHNGLVKQSKSVTIRVLRSDAERLSALAAAKQTTRANCIAEAIDLLVRQEFLSALDDEYRQLRPDLRTALLEEQQEWEITLSDGRSLVDDGSGCE